MIQSFCLEMASNITRKELYARISDMDLGLDSVKKERRIVWNHRVALVKELDLMNEKLHHDQINVGKMTEEGSELKSNISTVRRLWSDFDEFVLFQMDVTCGTSTMTINAKVLVDQSSIAGHEESHVDNKTKSFVCGEIGCGKNFARKAHLNRHVLTVHRHEKNFICSFDGCSSRFSHPFQRNRHEVVHGDKPIPCDFEGCKKRFRTITDQRTHRLLYKLKGNKCLVEGGGKSFERKRNLEAHSRNHTGETPFMCDFGDCLMAFTRKRYLTRHRRVRTGEKSLKCGFEGCDKSLDLAIVTFTNKIIPN